MKCNQCGIICGEERCSSCKGVERKYKKNCVSCNFPLPIVMKDHYIRYGNFCAECSCKCGYSGFHSLNIADLLKYR